VLLPLNRGLAVLLVLGPVGLETLHVAILGLLASRATQNPGQHRVTLHTHVAYPLVRRPVLELAVGVAIPYTSASIANIHVLLDLAAMAAHANVKATRLLSKLADKNKLLG
jgi:hypothetical protein